MKRTGEQHDRTTSLAPADAALRGFGNRTVTVQGHPNNLGSTMERHKDNIGFLRLLFASLVIISHAQEQIDGDGHRDCLYVVFHTITLGDFAVDAFFLISGYLITMSWMRTNSLNHYMKNRILRIYPAFILAYLLSVFVLGPLVGAAPWRWMAETIFRLIALQSPKIYPGQLSGLHYPDLNGSMWTIAYEFRCYLLVAAFGITGLLRRRWLILSMTAFGVLTLIAVTFPTIRAPIDTLGSHQRLNQIIGVPWYNIRLITTFLVGVCFYLFREELFQWLDARAALLAGACALAFLFRDPHLAEAGLITVGAACLFWVALKADIGLLRAVNNRWDVSYGVYLYGWPIATAIRWFDRGVPPWMLAAGTLLLAYLAGAASWWGVEKWAKAFSRLRSSPELARQSATAAATP